MNSVDQSLKRLAFWSKFVGYFMVVGGVLIALAGLIPYVFPAIEGVLMVILGRFLVKAGKKAEESRVTMSEQSLTEMIESLSRYFKWQGILTIVGVAVCSVVFLFVFFIFGVTALNGGLY